MSSGLYFSSGQVLVSHRPVPSGFRHKLVVGNDVELRLIKRPEISGRKNKIGQQMALQRQSEIVDLDRSGKQLFDRCQSALIELSSSGRRIDQNISVSKVGRMAVAGPSNLDENCQSRRAQSWRIMTTGRVRRRPSIKVVSIIRAASTAVSSGTLRFYRDRWMKMSLPDVHYVNGMRWSASVCSSNR